LGEGARRSSSPARLGEYGRLDGDGAQSPLSSGEGERGFAAWRQLVRMRQDREPSPPLRQRRNPLGNDRLGIVRLQSPQCSCKIRMMRFKPHVMCGDAVSTLERSATAGRAALRNADDEQASRLAAHRSSLAQGRDEFRSGASPRRLEMRLRRTAEG
jgi:hypothetical protein